MHRGAGRGVEEPRSLLLLDDTSPEQPGKGTTGGKGGTHTYERSEPRTQNWQRISVSTGRRSLLSTQKARPGSSSDFKRTEHEATSRLNVTLHRLL